MVMLMIVRSYAFVLCLTSTCLVLFGGQAIAQFDQESLPPTQSENSSSDPATEPLEDLSDDAREGDLRSDTIDAQDGSIFSPRINSDSSTVETIDAIEAPARNTQGQGADNTPVEISDRRATLRALEKVTARIQDLDIGLGETVAFKSLEITLRTCNKRPPEETPETTAFLEIVDNKPDGEALQVFTGWMFASSPALNALEHPVYDVWVIDCRISDPVDGLGSL